MPADPPVPVVPAAPLDYAPSESPNRPRRRLTVRLVALTSAAHLLLGYLLETADVRGLDDAREQFSMAFFYPLWIASDFRRASSSSSCSP